MNKEETKLTIKERLCIYICLFVVKVLKPYGYEHEIKEMEKLILAELGKA